MKRIVALLIALLWVGCGSQEEFVVVGPVTVPAATGSIEVDHLLARALTVFVRDISYTGLASDGSIVYGPTLRPKAARTVLEGVSTSIRALRIEYLNNGRVIGRFETEVALAPGEVITVSDPAWTDVAPEPPVFERGESTSTGDGPVGVGAGDFNNDGHPDVAVTNSSDDTVSIFLGDGTGFFAAPTTVAVGDNPFHVIGADLNDDGHWDLVVSNFGRTGEVMGDVAILLGNGDGTFTAAPTLVAQNQPIAAAVADFDGDGRHDIAVANYESTSVSVFPGLGDGTFAAASQLTVGARPHDVLAEDLNGDGQVDLVVANEGLGMGGGDVCTLLGDGAGAFAAPAFFATGRNPRNAEVIDVNGDGILDVLTGNFTDGNISVLLGLGDGSLGLHREFETGGVPLSIVAADLNGDGRPDIAAACAGLDQVVVLSGFGDGSFSSPSGFAVGDLAIYLDKADFNSDGKADLAAVGFGSSGEAGNLTVLLGQ